MTVIVIAWIWAYKNQHYQVYCQKPVGMIDVNASGFCMSACPHMMQWIWFSFVDLRRWHVWLTLLDWPKCCLIQEVLTHYEQTKLRTIIGLSIESMSTWCMVNRYSTIQPLMVAEKKHNFQWLRFGTKGQAHGWNWMDILATRTKTCWHRSTSPSNWALPFPVQRLEVYRLVAGQMLKKWFLSRRGVHIEQQQSQAQEKKMWSDCWCRNVCMYIVNSRRYEGWLTHGIFKIPLLKWSAWDI